MSIDPLLSTSPGYASDGPGMTGRSRLSAIEAIHHVAGLSERYLPYLLLAALVATLYSSVVWHLAVDWYQLEDFAHGFLIPPFLAFVVWDQRKTLSKMKPVPTWQGLWAIFPALFLLMAGQLGAGRFFSRISLVLFLTGVIWTLGGVKVLNQTKFLVLACLLAIPLPGPIYATITGPLQLLASKVVSALLPLAGVPVFRTGNIIQLPALQLEVAQACSGIRSLMSLMTVTLIFGYLAERSAWRRTVLALASVPIAVASNVARIFITGLCVQYWDPAKAEGLFHEFSGVVMFVVSLCCLYAVHMVMHVSLDGADAV